MVAFRCGGLHATLVRADVTSGVAIGGNSRIRVRACPTNANWNFVLARARENVRIELSVVPSGLANSGPIDSKRIDVPDCACAAAA